MDDFKCNRAGGAPLTPSPSRSTASLDSRGSAFSADSPAAASNVSFPFSSATPDRLHEQIPLVMEAVQALQCLNVENASLRVQLESMKVITAAAADASSLHPRDNDAASADAPHSIVDHGMADSPDDTGFLQMVHSTLEEQRAYLGSRSSRLQDYQSHLQHLASVDSGLSAQLDALSRTREAHIRREHRSFRQMEALLAHELTRD